MTLALSAETNLPAEVPALMMLDQERRLLPFVSISAMAIAWEMARTV